MLFLKTKTQLAEKRELGGSRFSCIYKRPQSELKSAPLKCFQRLRTIPSRAAKVNKTNALCSDGGGVKFC
ncbi:hypothetical protein [Ferribacterium limneticum]|uniref:hypothetical protein n=1 Tax=Ferribacterium limneticum TaxID=76259 RepID=UPI001CFC060E|nr:hypothetical protein [Ferribacterium limneticum]UCV28671.1 hypothetical protein KI617_00710 [Ferribacterium limneticum]UCV32588.1 hypothetical protein KI608_00710 [Ferribacterium limneticum]